MPIRKAFCQWRYVVRIVLIKKKELANQLGYYRPISLQNIDVKILRRILANQLQPVMGKIISPNQGYAVVGRSIHDAATTNRDWAQ